MVSVILFVVLIKNQTLDIYAYLGLYMLPEYFKMISNLSFSEKLLLLTNGSYVISTLIRNPNYSKIYQFHKILK